MDGSALLAVIGLAGGLATILGWVVKRVFEYSDRHAQVVESNTKSNVAVSNSMEKLAQKIENHDESTKPIVMAQSKLLEIISGIAQNQNQTLKTQEEILKTQKEIVELVRGMIPNDNKEK